MIVMYYRGDSRMNKTLAETAMNGPLYREVRRRILDCLSRGEWKPGDVLPNERELAERFGVAISTVRAGVGELTATGVLVRRQGKGTFVARHNAGPQQFRYSNVYDDAGTKLSTLRTVRSLQRVRADPPTIERLQLQRERQPHIYRIEATLTDGDRAVGVMELILPAHLFPKAKREDFEQTGENLYTLYQRKWGVTVMRMEEWVSARAADAKTARILKVPAAHPLMRLERVAYSFNDLPVEIRNRVYEGTAHRYLFKHDKLD